MLTAIEGFYRNGVVELTEVPAHAPENARVLVTFLENGNSGSTAGELDQEQMAELRARLQTFAADWESEEMNIYDDYDAAKSRL